MLCYSFFSMQDTDKKYCLLLSRIYHPSRWVERKDIVELRRYYYGLKASYIFNPILTYFVCKTEWENMWNSSDGHDEFFNTANMIRNVAWVDVATFHSKSLLDTIQPVGSLLTNYKVSTIEVLNLFDCKELPIRNICLLMVFDALLDFGVC